MRLSMVLLASLCLLTSGTIQAEPYFHLEPLKQVNIGGFFKIGSPADRVSWGFVTPVIRHNAEDGFLWIPGVTWDLLRIGWVKPAGNSRGMVALGPSINLDEPIKKFLRDRIDWLPGSGAKGAYSALRWILVPCDIEDTCTAIAVGPMQAWQVIDGYRLGTWRGSLQIAVTINKRF